MKKETYLVMSVGEEGAEVTQRASKLMKFGKDEIQPGHTETNWQRLKQEFNDLCGTMEQLANEFGETQGSVYSVEQKTKKKKANDKYYQIHLEQNPNI